MDNLILPANHVRGPWELLGFESVQWTQIAEYLGWDEEKLRAFGDEFNVPIEAWNEMHMKGSINYMDCIALYAIIRYMKPEQVLELGCFIGTSTYMLLTAILDNGFGHITSVDIKPVGQTWTVHGETKRRSENVENVDKEYITLVESDATEYLTSMQDNSVPFIFEDSSHSYEHTRSISIGAKFKLQPGGIIVFHDATIESMVCGFKDAGIYDSMITTTPHSPLGIWRKPRI